MKNILLVACFLVFGPMAFGQFTDDMESYVDGQPIEGGWWYNNCGTGCTMVASSAEARSGELSGYITDDGISSVILDLGNKNNGLWHLGFWMFIPSNRDAYWQIKGCVPVCTEDWNIWFLFNNLNNNPGIGEIHNSALGPLEFTFPHDTWFEVRMNVDLTEGMSNATWQLYIDGQEVIPCETPYTTESGEVPFFLGGIEFFSNSANNGLYLDDFVYNNAPDPCAPFTSIPDPQFEQALIDLGIDSDGEVNGYVLTSDVENVVNLDVSYIGIQDVTGLEDFTALEILDVSGNELENLNVSGNIALRELYCNSQSGAFSMLMTTMDFSNNTNLELFYGENLIMLEGLNFKNGNNAILTVELSCEFEGIPCELSDLYCVQVDDEVAANNAEPPYNDWFIQAPNMVYSEDCSLGVTPFNNLGFVLWPNPASEIVTIMNQYNVKVNSATIFDTMGRRVNKNSSATESIDVSNLTPGVYFIQITTDQGTVTQKIIKE